ncbi:MAG: hypothetical protein JNK65_09580, partial [Deltaproteobacteria bacterium]|nr:hypothetical protein [Deltaproteobacteria bacterium]
YYIDNAYAANCKVGDKAQVKWKGSWYPATVTNSKGKNCYIHYDGYDQSLDEWVGPERIRIRGTHSIVGGENSYNVGEAVSVKWKDSWWPAKVLKSESDRWYIHYDGYGSNWDEWVGPGRIQKR